MNVTYLFARLSVRSIKPTINQISARNISLNTSLLIKPTQCLFAAPLKKRHKLDPGQIRAREEKRKRKLEKEIRRLQKFAQTLKPIEEMQLPLHIQDQREQRERETFSVSPIEEEQRALLLKKWSHHCFKENLASMKLLDQLEYSQRMALDKLREESEELYQAALQVDDSLINISIKGPTVTPPIKDYDSPDGDYQNTSFKWG
ncbi:39S ribosomal protein L40, mitochondrial [Frankliniella occidentalis]|uniref:Large ribosomal subunit protein mL40 n=1 Tax=Frankliniella occidentalis TaxID=133901 RepID=A0A6J1SSW3_FRAOC|nr:39S ribosomal protein L40, mitochondrial [Frankliniella occidentalis]